MNLYGYDIRKSFDDYDKYRIPQISMPHAGDYFLIALKSICNQKGIPDDKIQFLPEYEKVVEWLTDNKQKGLIMGGANGRGKSLIGEYVIPSILRHVMGKVVNCYKSTEINQNLDVIMTKKYVYIDDMGVEDKKSDYGSVRWAMPEIIDNAEKFGKLLIISTNLSSKDIAEKYGHRTFDRIFSICHPIKFEGDSMRQKK
jgi:DNA replication protein DnaC